MIRPASPPIPASDAAASAHSPALLAGIATRLTHLAEGAEAFGLVLCSDAEVASRHLVELQQIDRLAQSLREMAQVLTAADPEAAVAGIRLGELRSALEQADAR